MKKKPVGYIAICQCGRVVGAMDLKNTDRIDAGKILGQWVSEGCTLEPKFDYSWTATVSACGCD
ncbi:MAG: hypothetical protein CMI05_05275 [Oceanospirillaceae bacterium]|nr:hypothetical protein [Oceanospirillaceae bacterium]|tara:strand:+ start:1774 stop:1965 length:192 start_codon:yes stop_codon:yes gene_type:complete